MGTIAYKALEARGTSPYQRFLWPLPTDGKPGDWVKAEGAPVICFNGVHAFESLAEAERHGEVVYEIELAGELVAGHGKLAAARGRLLRLVAEFAVEGPIEHGIRLCVKCGEPHASYRRKKGHAPNWGHPDDGHAYHPEPWETLVLRLIAERDALRAQLEER